MIFGDEMLGVRDFRLFEYAMMVDVHEESRCVALEGQFAVVGEHSHSSCLRLQGSNLGRECGEFCHASTHDLAAELRFTW